MGWTGRHVVKVIVGVLARRIEWSLAHEGIRRREVVLQLLARSSATHFLDLRLDLPHARETCQETRESALRALPRLGEYCVTACMGAHLVGQVGIVVIQRANDIAM